MALALIEALPLIFFITLLAGLLALLAYWRNSKSHEVELDVATDDPPIVHPRRRRGGLARMQQAVQVETLDEDDDDGDDPAASSSASRLKKKKERNKEAKREAREAHLAQLEALREREALEDEERAAKQEEEQRLRAEQEEIEKKKQEEKEKAEQEEYENWKDLISVEEAGDEVDQIEAEDPELLTRFCEYIRTSKIVVLEDLAAEFSLRTEEAIHRLATLEELGTLTGFFDDRGKFIYVSNEEMTAVAQFITKKGRVSIQELAAESSRLLHLDSAATA